uniref:UDP-glucuronosyltransferase 2B9 n=2 Tax=Cacopsylla melanoneura TaxID=428564 RepID=A0A8D8UGL3_9HEMI
MSQLDIFLGPKLIPKYVTTCPVYFHISMKRVSSLLVVTLLTSFLYPRCHGYHILVLGVFPFYSHLMMLSVISNELVSQGHNVTFVTVKTTRPHPNLNLIINKDVMTGQMNPEFLKNLGRAGSRELTRMLWSLAKNGTDTLLATKELKSFIDAPLDDPKRPKFDAIISETYFLHEALSAGFAQKFSCPLINFQPLVSPPNVAYMIGDPHNPAYMPDYKMTFTSNMNFWQRLENTYFSVYSTLYQNLIYLPAMDKIMRTHFATVGASNWPYIADILRERQTLTLVDASFTMTGSIAHAPNVADIGGLHIVPGQPLPKDIADFVSSFAEHGIIYFSMGSYLNAEILEEWRVERLIRLFATLKQGVLWKTTTSPQLSARLPSNVKISKWFPQNDILAHPSCRLFITHGGIHSAFESIYHGVPMLIIPVFADQKQNGQRAHEVGYGEAINFEKFEYEELSDKLQAVLFQTKYKSTVQHLSNVYKSSPVHPLQKAISGIEYVIRTGGAAHLKTKATDLPWYQLLLLDVIGFCLILLGLILYVVYRTGGILLNLVYGNQSTVKVKQSVNKKKQ